jgi:hypothetical protein
MNIKNVSLSICFASLLATAGCIASTSDSGPGTEGQPAAVGAETPAPSTPCNPSQAAAGCKADLPTPSCPNPNDPTVKYMNNSYRNPGACLATNAWRCDDGWKPFVDIQQCGCACIQDPTEPSPCPDPNDPTVQYMNNSYRNPTACMATNAWRCDDGWKPFVDIQQCGCACVRECPNPNDPGVQYAYQDPMQCAVLLFACPEGKRAFSDECGCGCIPTPVSP